MYYNSKVALVFSEVIKQYPHQSSIASNIETFILKDAHYMKPDMT